ncbi:MAG: hypothetical protein AMXMBFR84_48250 [Candidatus Hydrogenedentota bacterium]
MICPGFVQTRCTCNYATEQVRIYEIAPCSERCRCDTIVRCYRSRNTECVPILPEHFGEKIEGLVTSVKLNQSHDLIADCGGLLLNLPNHMTGSEKVAI